jgi:hypothetical protein
MAEPVIAPEKQMSRFQAQRKLGLFAPHDFVCLGVVLLIWISALVWKLVGSPTGIQLIGLALAAVFLTQCWIIVLVYRGLVFILDVQADINLMPESAARIVLGFWEGRKK